VVARPKEEKEYWPPGVERAETLTAFEKAFVSLGFVPCDGPDLEDGFDRIAIFAGSNGIPTHAARQLANGRWTSKIGELEDIEHELHDLTGTDYGAIVLFMKRRAQA